MNHSEELTKFKENVKSLIARNRIEEALETIGSAGKFNISFSNEFILLSSRFYNLKDISNFGTGDPNILNKNRNEISKSLIELIDKIDEKNLLFFLENSEYVKELKGKLKEKEKEILAKDKEIASLLNSIELKEHEYLLLLENFERTTKQLSTTSTIDVNKLSSIELIKLGENQQIEFKRGIGNEDMPYILKTIVGFMNARGGVMLVGVDSGKIYGINTSNEFIVSTNFRLFEYISVKIGKPFLQLIQYDTEKIEDKIIIRITCEPSKSPVFYREFRDDKEMESFFVRTGAKTTALYKTAEIIQYIQLRDKI